MAKKTVIEEVEMSVRLTFIEEVLGTLPRDPLVVEDYLKGPDATSGPRPDDERAALAAGIEATEAEELLEEKGSPPTIFSRDGQGRPILWDYQIKGFFKDAAGAFYRIKKTDWPAYKKIVDTLIFVEPRELVLTLPEGAKLSWCQRPIRVVGAHGERVALVVSETCPPGTILDCKIVVLRPDLLNWVETFLDYGQRKGIGQWRNSGKGRFQWTELA